MKKSLAFISLIAAFIFATSGGANTHAAEVHYKDVKKNDHYFDAVQNLLDQNAISSSLPKFNPYANVTRGQAASIIAKTLRLDTTKIRNVYFKDVPKDHQYYPYIAALQNAGIMNGKPDSVFGVNDPLTRGQMAAILVKGFDIPPIDIYNVDKDVYSDVIYSEHDGYQKYRFSNQFSKSIMSLDYFNLVSGYEDGTFKINKPITRSQLALMIDKIQTKMPEYEIVGFRLLGLEDPNDGLLIPDAKFEIADQSIISFKNLIYSDSQYIMYEDGYLNLHPSFILLEPHKEGTTYFKNLDLNIIVKKVNAEFRVTVEKKTLVVE